MATYKCTKCGYVHTASSAKEWGKLALGLAAAVGLLYAGTPVVAALGGGAFLSKTLKRGAKFTAKEIASSKCPKCGGELKSE